MLLQILPDDVEIIVSLYGIALDGTAFSFLFILQQ
jgi:hypothetical protein